MCLRSIIKILLLQILVECFKYGLDLLKFRKWCHLHLFSITSNYHPLKEVWPFISTNFNLLLTMLFCAKCGWSWLRSSAEDKYVNSFQTDGETDGRTDRQTPDKKWSFKHTWTFSSGQLKQLKKPNEIKQRLIGIIKYPRMFDRRLNDLKCKA